MPKYIVTLKRERQTDRELKVKEYQMMDEISVIPGTKKEIYEMSKLEEIIHILRNILKVAI